jgi:hypothetical protein
VFCVLSVGLWVLASFIHHSCSPNLHVGDYVIVHTSRDVKAGEEITFLPIVMRFRHSIGSRKCQRRGAFTVTVRGASLRRKCVQSNT